VGVSVLKVISFIRGSWGGGFWAHTKGWRGLKNPINGFLSVCYRGPGGWEGTGGGPSKGRGPPMWLPISGGGKRRLVGRKHGRSV